MNKNIFAFTISFCLVLAFLAYSQEANPKIVQGKVEAISPANDQITIDGKKITIEPQFIEDYYIEVGDNIKVEVEDEAGNMKAKSAEFYFPEDEEDFSGTDMSTSNTSDSESQYPSDNEGM